MSAAVGDGALDGEALRQALTLFLLLCARLVPLCLLAPFVALGAMPNLISFALLFALAVCLWPAAQASAAALPALSPLACASTCLREVLLGLVFALALALPLRAIEWAGRIAGRASALPGAAASYGGLQLALGVATFFALGGQRVAIRLLASELARRPLGAIAQLPDLRAIALSSAQLVGDAFGSAFLLALPLLAALGMAELGLVLVARTAPAFATVFAPTRALLALVLFALTTSIMLHMLPETFDHGLRAARRVLGGP